MANTLLDKLSKNSSIHLTETLGDSVVFGKKTFIPTPVPMVNVALSGRVDGGLTAGHTMLAGPSKHFKTAFSLLMASSYLKHYDDGVILFYDSEFGTPESYFDTFSIDKERVLHSPITDIEELKFDLVQQLKGLQRGDHVCIIIDSIGNLASKKEVEDALDQKSVVDMTRAKQMKSLFRMITPYLTILDVPLITINHTYKTLEMFSKDVVSGGTGSYYSADNIWIIGRRQEKEGTDVSGYNFVINIEKSRFVKEKSKIPITVLWEGGINKWSGLFEVALSEGYITAVKKGTYAAVDQETGEISEKTYKTKALQNDKDFWISLFKETDFASHLNKKYSISGGEIMSADEDEDE